MTDLDLDALEKWSVIVLEDSSNPAERDNATQFLALIQRLREAEADCTGLEADVRAEFSEYLGNANARIAQLERVREAAKRMTDQAIELRDFPAREQTVAQRLAVSQLANQFEEQINETRAALAAVEEK